ncbi:MAG: hypothetical protein IT221_09210 [Fluviicola sp.]|nr:hypothetical protein [Fluviicola sp.]
MNCFVLERKLGFNFILTVLMFFKASPLFSQDSIQVKNAQEFNRFIQYSFFFENEVLTPTIQRKAKRLSKQYDFTDKKYKSRYVFDFNIYLDSNGYVKECHQNTDFHDMKLDDFQLKIVDLINNSNLKFKNGVVTQDTAYYLNYLRFTFEMFCDSKELIFNGHKKKLKSHKKSVVYYKENAQIISFNDFVNFQSNE